MIPAIFTMKNMLDITYYKCDREEQYEIVQAYLKNPSDKTFERVCSLVSQWAKRQAYKFHRRNISKVALEEYEQGCLVGIERAAHVYDKEKGNFVSIANWYILDELNKIAAFHASMVTKSNFRLGQIRRGKISSNVLNMSSLNVTLENGMEVQDTLVGNTDLEKEYGSTEISLIMTDLLRSFYSTLEERDQTVFKHRIYNVDDPEADKLTLEEISLLYSISRERVRQLEVKLKNSLVKYIKSDGRIRREDYT